MSPLEESCNIQGPVQAADFEPFSSIRSTVPPQLLVINRQWNGGQFIAWLNIYFGEHVCWHCQNCEGSGDFTLLANKESLLLFHECCSIRLLGQRCRTVYLYHCFLDSTYKGCHTICLLRWRTVYFHRNSRNQNNIVFGLVSWVPFPTEWWTWARWHLSGNALHCREELRTYSVANFLLQRDIFFTALVTKCACTLLQRMSPKAMNYADILEKIVQNKGQAWPYP